MKAWAGGGQLSVARPPPAALLERRRPRSDQPGRVIPGDTR
jgi:hypothetical protein